MNPHHTWFRQNSAHLLIISKNLFQNIFPSNTLKAPLQGELTKYLSASSDTKNICLLVTLPPRRDHFQSIRTTTSPRQYPCLQWLVSTTSITKNPAWFYQRRKYRFSQLHKYRKSICAFFRQTPMCEILGQSHWCSQDSISRIKILISNPQVSNIKTCPKSLNYRYAGFQILDWNSNFQSSLVLTTDKLQQIFTHQDLFTIKNFIHKNIVYYCCLSKKNGQQLSQSSLFPFVFLSLSMIQYYT